MDKGYIGSAHYLERNKRQIIVPEIGEEGQQRLSNSKVLVIGAGGLGSPILLYLGAAGIGTIGIVDFDVVSLSNLPRQVLHWEKDLDKPKVDSAREKLLAQNPQLDIRTYRLMLSDENAGEIFKDYDLIISAVDNIEARYIINRACSRLGIPWIDGGIDSFYGSVTVYKPDEGCMECLYPEERTKPSRSPIPVVSTTPGIIGML